MAVILKNGAIFLHVPKTGGTWIHRTLKSMDLVRGNTATKHADIDRVFTPTGNTPGRIFRFYARWMTGAYPGRQPFIFAFVRNPLTWYESWFKYMSRTGLQWGPAGDANDLNHWHPCAGLNGLGDTDFNQFVRNVIREQPGFVTQMYGGYTRSPVRFVGRMENLRDDLVRVLLEMGLAFDEQAIREAPPINTAFESQNTIQWEPELREQVTRLEYAGMLRYGYLTET